MVLPGPAGQQGQVRRHVGRGQRQLAVGHVAGQPGGQVRRARRQPVPDYRDSAHGAQLVRRRVGYHPPVGQHDDPAGQALRLVQVVGGEQDAGPARGEVLDDRPEPPPGLRVQAGGRLVQEQHLRLAHDGDAQVHSPSLAPAQRADPGPGVRGHVDDVEDLAARRRPG